MKGMKKMRQIKYKGKTKSIVEWAKEYNLSYDALNVRIKRGWDIAKALTEPPRVYRRR